MPSGTATGASVLAGADAVPAPPPPGLSVVGAADVDLAGVLLAGRLGSALPLTVDEAGAELRRRRERVVAAPTERVRALRATASAARDAATGGRRGLSSVPPDLSAAAVRAAARRLHDAAEAVRAAREVVGSRPEYDERAAAEARAAQVDVDQARSDGARALPRASRALVIANAGALAIVVGRAMTEAFDRAFVLVAVLPVVALAYAARAVFGPARRARAAARRRWSALRSMGVSTLPGLAALEERAGAWERRAARVTTAEHGFARARDEWRSLVGDAVALASAERLAADLDAAASLDAAAADAEAAWAAAAVELQVVEDTFGLGGAPLVVIAPGADRGLTGSPGDALAALAGATPVVVVVFAPEPVVVAPEPITPVVVAAPPLSAVPASWATAPPTPRQAPAGAAAVAASTPPAASMALAPALAAPIGPPDSVPLDGRPDRRDPASAIRLARGLSPVATEPAAGTHEHDALGVIVDLRDRVKAGLLRLRARSGPPRSPSAGGSAAAGG